jgi:hypothetical protein
VLSLEVVRFSEITSTLTAETAVDLVVVVSEHASEL